MTNGQCELVRSWLHQPTTQQPELVTHITQCATCRGALVALLAEGTNVASPPATSCASCQDDLDSYIDTEVTEGVRAAMRRFPHVWWHLWVCQDCAETYRLIHALVDAEASGALSPMPSAAGFQPTASFLRFPPIRLDRSFLHAVFAPQAALGTAWHTGEDEYIIAEEHLAEHHLTISVRHHRADVCSVYLVIAPPVTSAVVVRFGETAFRSRFDEQGEAVIPNVPVGLLTQANGPDMELVIVDDDGVA